VIFFNKISINGHLASSVVVALLNWLLTLPKRVFYSVVPGNLVDTFKGLAIEKTV